MKLLPSLMTRLQSRTMIPDATWKYVLRFPESENSADRTVPHNGPAVRCPKCPQISEAHDPCSQSVSMITDTSRSCLGMGDKYSKARYFNRRRALRVLIPIALAAVILLLGYFTMLEAPKAPDVVTLTDDNFDSLVLNSDPRHRHRQPWLVEFYAPWCPHCRKFANEYIEVGKRLKGTVHVGYVDVVANKALGKRFGVSNFPTFMIFGPDEPDPDRYQGPRTVEALVSKALAVAAQQ